MRDYPAPWPDPPPSTKAPAAPGEPILARLYMECEGCGKMARLVRFIFESARKTVANCQSCGWLQLREENYGTSDSHGGGAYGT